MKKSFLAKIIILAGSLLLQLGTLCFHARGGAGDVDLSFDPGSGVNGTVQAVAVQPDGKVIIAGQFTTVNGRARSKVARLNADGSGDSSFNAGTGTGGWEEYAHAVALQSDGKVLVSNNGGFSRLNSDGSQDTNFIAGLGYVCSDEECFSSVYSIAVQSDGKVLVGGFFSTLNGTNYSTGVARLNANGSLDGSFNPGTGANSIGSVALQSDGKVLIAGNHVTTVNGPVFNGITRLNANGSLDSSFNPGTGPDNGVYSIALQPDGKALIGGGFTIVDGANRRCLARLNADGSLDGSFNPGAGTDYVVRSIALQADGKVLIGGSFTTVNGTNRNRLARLNSDGGLDSSFNPATATGGASYDVNSVVVQPDGEVLIGGDFVSVNGTNHNYLDRFNADGSLDSNFNPGREVATGIWSLVVQPDGKVLIGGLLTFINGTNRYGTARLSPDGSLDSTFVSDSFYPQVGVTGVAYAVPESLAVQPDGKVLVGGWTAKVVSIDEFDNYYWSFGYFVSRVNANGSHDTNFNPVVGGDYGAYARDPWAPTVRALAVQPDGKVLVSSSGIFRLNSNGSPDGSFINPGGGNAYAIALQPDGRVLVGRESGIARLNSDGSLDPSFNSSIPGGNPFQHIYSLVLQPDGRLLVGGSFTTVNGTNLNRIARLNFDGSVDGSFNPGMGADGIVRSIALQSDGNVLIGGDFTKVNGVARPHVARLYGDSAAPSLNIARSNAFVIVSWPASATGFVLQQNTNLNTTHWTSPSETIADNGTTRFITVSPAPGNRFFRLFKP